MGKYDFVSVGAAGGNALEQFFIKRALEERQQMLDAQNRQKNAADIRQRDEQIRIQKSREEREVAEGQALAAERAKAAEQAASKANNERGVNQMIGDRLMQGPLDVDSARQIAGMGIREGVQVPGIVAQAMTPPKQESFTLGEGQVRFGPDGKVLAQGPAKQQAPMSEAQQLANEMRRIQIEQAQGKLDADKAWRDKTGEDAKRVTENALGLAQRLKTHPGMSKAYGAYEMRGFMQDAQDAKGIRDQLVAALTLPNLGALKGPMSDKDVAFVKQLGTRLANDSLSDEEAQRAVDEAILFLQSKGGGSGAAAAPAANNDPLGLRK
jgi:hypothetical protein